MPFISLDETQHQEQLQLFYQEYGSGQPVILIHGWPLSHRAWEPQMQVIADAGFRAIAYDRRGFGVSSLPYENFDYSTLARDLHTLIEQLDLKDVILVGFSMGGGEVVRYFTDFGSDRIAKAVLISSIIPLVPKKDDNPDGVPEAKLQEIMGALKSDRVTFLNEFSHNFYNADKTDVSEQQIQYAWTIAAFASPRATIECAKSWGGTDFRPECKNVTVPTLIVHGDADQIVPIETAGKQAAKMIPNNEYHVIKEAPHGLNLTHRDELNKILLQFLQS
ncbi:alpha/beta fold hydrolase [Flavilitoribacter nigricans]|uniref:Alpha/beta hydrolase n=1 Tax=Flavilitoribacter nigricans (strain ATCC 23147 / DSM 23189 / NBRC 102662 / NCIMB 1420 / SS-2) TaxID=1122177 RepID=A0A2D0N8U1_FLAN2|nr:alpha/beta hydrolase [Flavilitoribacter nigricans]PHN04569.1 alpha/beta hydrolase [Flavilitoribacter nigricans DSM 23189 = NBRC 102662]